MTATDHPVLLDLTTPAGWRVVPLWALFTRSKVLGHIDEPMLSVFRDHGVVRKDSLPNLNKTAEDRSIYQFVDDGWLVVNRMKAFQGSVGVSLQRGIVSGHYICFRPRHSESSRYLNWLLRSDVYRTIFYRLSRGVRPGQIEIDNDYLHSIPVLLPPLAVQRRIADFLDDQVTRIDQAIARRKRQGNLVRQRVESMAAMMVRDLGPVRSTRLSRLYRHIQQGASPLGTGVEVAGDQPGVIKTSCVQDGTFVVGENKALAHPQEYEARFQIRTGDLIIVRGSGSGDLVADAAVVSKDVAGMRLMLSDLVYRLVDLRANAHFVCAFLLSPQGRAQVRALVRQGSGPAKVRGEDIGSISVPVIEDHLQLDFAKAYWGMRSEVELIDSTLKAGVDLLQQRKRSLITAAVTGELDVSTASSRASDVVMDGAGG